MMRKKVITIAIVAVAIIILSISAFTAIGNEYFANRENQAYDACVPTVEFSTIRVWEKFYNESGDYVELDLVLPVLSGDYAGIPQINEFFLGRVQHFCDELDFETYLRDLDEIRIEHPNDIVYNGLSSNLGREARYMLGASFGNVISISAELDGGMGGVSWSGAEGHTFDLDTGKRLGLSDIFAVTEEQYMSLIYDHVSREIAESMLDSSELGHEEHNMYLFDDPYSGAGYDSIRQFDQNDFFLQETSLVVFYPKYALAPGFAGMTLNYFYIPYSEIEDMLAINLTG